MPQRTPHNTRLTAYSPLVDELLLIISHYADGWRSSWPKWYILFPQRVAHLNTNGARHKTKSVDVCHSVTNKPNNKPNHHHGECNSQLHMTCFVIHFVTECIGDFHISVPYCRTVGCSLSEYFFHRCFMLE